MPEHAGGNAAPILTARMKGGVARFKAEGTWSRGRIYAAVKKWRGADAELLHRRRHHTLVLTLRGGSDLTGTRISGSSPYEGRDSVGCLTFVPSGAERRGWYRNADLDFVVLLVDPDFVRAADFGLPADGLAPFTNRRDPLLESLLAALSVEMRAGASALPSLYAEHVAGLAMSHLVRASGRAPAAGGSWQARLHVVLEFIEENLERDISLSELAALAGTVPDVLARNFRRQLGIPPYRYLMERRVRRAEVLLAAGESSIAEIALAVGFASQSHFTTQFRKLSGLTPAAYRAQRRS
jgi:AraC family transcriptional regulator